MIPMIRRGEGALELMKRKGVVARNKATRDKEYTPIKLMLKEMKNVRTSAFDIFVLGQEESARGRPVNTIHISRANEKNFVGQEEFVLDTETGEMFVYIPKTEWNMKVLASNLNEQWDIENQDILDVLPALKEQLMKEAKDAGNPVLEHEPHQMADHGAQAKQSQVDADKLKRLEEENERLKKMAKNRPQEVAAATMPLSEAAIKEIATHYVAEHFADKIEEFKKAHGKGYWRAKEYIDLLNQAMDRFRNIPVGEPNAVNA